MLSKCCPIFQQIWKSQQWLQDWKRSVFIPIAKKGNAKWCSNYHIIARISHTSKVMLKILQARLQEWTKDFQMFKLDLENAEEPEIQLPTSVGSTKKQESSRKTSTSAYWLHQSLWLCGSQQTGKFFKRWEYQTTWPVSWEICMQVKKQQLEPNMDNRLVPNRERSMSRLYIVTLLITYMQNTSCEMPSWMKHKLESRLLWGISII